jgi:hypothetical protein
VLGEVGEQKMKIDKPGEWLPLAHGGLNAGIVERLAAVEPTREVVAGADVVPRKDVQPAQPAQKRILCRPAHNSAQSLKDCERVVVVERLDRARVEHPTADSGGELDNAA